MQHNDGVLGSTSQILQQPSHVQPVASLVPVAILAYICKPCTCEYLLVVTYSEGEREGERARKRERERERKRERERERERGREGERERGEESSSWMQQRRSHTPRGIWHVEDRGFVAVPQEASSQSERARTSYSLHTKRLQHRDNLLEAAIHVICDHCAAV